MEQVTLWHEDIYEALATDIQACGGNKTVGHCLWPEKSPSKAGADLSTCLNRARSEKLSPEQLVLVIGMARAAGSYATINFIADTTNFEKPVPVEPEGEHARLQREFNTRARDLQKMLERMETLGQRRPKAV